MSSLIANLYGSAEKQILDLLEEDSLDSRYAIFANSKLVLAIVKNLTKNPNLALETKLLEQANSLARSTARDHLIGGFFQHMLSTEKDGKDCKPNAELAASFYTLTQFAKLASFSHCYQTCLNFIFQHKLDSNKQGFVDQSFSCPHFSLDKCVEKDLSEEEKKVFLNYYTVKTPAKLSQHGDSMESLSEATGLHKRQVPILLESAKLKLRHQLESALNIEEIRPLDDAEQLQVLSSLSIFFLADIAEDAKLLDLSEQALTRLFPLEKPKFGLGTLAAAVNVLLHQLQSTWTEVNFSRLSALVTFIKSQSVTISKKVVDTFLASNAPLQRQDVIDFLYVCRLSARLLQDHALQTQVTQWIDSVSSAIMPANDRYLLYPLLTDLQNPETIFVFMGSKLDLYEVRQQTNRDAYLSARLFFIEKSTALPQYLDNVFQSAKTAKSLVVQVTSTAVKTLPFDDALNLIGHR